MAAKTCSMGVSAKLLDHHCMSDVCAQSARRGFSHLFRRCGICTSSGQLSPIDISPLIQSSY